MWVQKCFRAGGSPAYLVLDSEFRPIEPVMKYLRYLEAVGRSPNTIKAYAGDLRLYWEFLESRGLCWREVSIQDLSEFSLWLRCPTPKRHVVPLHQASERTEGTVNRIIGALGSFYEFQERLGVCVRLASHELKRAPFRRYKSFLHHVTKGKAVSSRVFKLKEPRRFPGCLTGAEVSCLVEACRFLRDRLLINLLYESGLRIGEALGLYHEDLESGGKNVIRVVPREHPAVWLQQKSKSERRVEVSMELMKLYSAYLVDEYPTLPHSNYVFVRKAAAAALEPLPYTMVQSLFRSLERRTGIHATPHLLRHTHATELIRSGCSMRYVQTRLGHSQIQTTLDTYVHLTNEDLERAYRSFMERGGQHGEC